MTPSFAIRVDAATHIGSGHLMRCLTLAHQLRTLGARVRFLCRAHPGHLNHRIRAEGFDLTELPLPSASPVERSQPLPSPSPTDDLSLYGATWLGATWQEDAAQCALNLEPDPVDWLIIDHYGLDARFETAVQSGYRRLMVIDDLANRPHVCDVLLDQTLGREQGDYLPFIPIDCPCLLGLRYALLRPEFARYRGESLQRRATATLETLLIALGGTDPDNHTGALLEALAHLPQMQHLKLSVIMGESAPHRAAVAQRLASLPMTTAFFSGVNNMAEHLVHTDLAIGAAGSSAWERCCLGVPTLQLVLAENQALAAQQLTRHGAVLPLAPPYGATLKRLCTELTPPTLQRLSAQAAQLVDGLGAARVATLLMNCAPSPLSFTDTDKD